MGKVEPVCLRERDGERKSCRWSLRGKKVG